MYTGMKGKAASIVPNYNPRMNKMILKKDFRLDYGGFVNLLYPSLLRDLNELYVK